ncbi:ABC transporter ATP-binding protein [Emticicia sp. BO119]|uniref:ABC transporter ATP-binding protein n=1 Tax=Emticicia sp. BO119 TaxID=2757768 RepID=UPI0015F09B0C|nr:ABC transporter ATP-binding protein [Emticicia sp. BO119]MBA4848934.1 ABC transporter ATP-binding protein [Emticicia sp. BO119]
MTTIQVSNVSHQFSNQEYVLDNINLNVREGSIYGFLGPNGAGKTTTLRLILGLLKKQKGKIEIFGKPFDSHRIEILNKIGSLIESPSIYGHLTAINNLKVWQKIYQSPDNRIGEVLELVGLAHTKNKKASQFSLGMKQRLGIAVALLHNPSLLILDEPTNGLDPSGIVEIRELLKRLNQQHGITIIISSHLLGEIEKLVTDVGIINKGKMLFESSLTDLMNRQHQASTIYFDTNDNATALQLMHQQKIAAQIEKERIVVSQLSKHTIAQINQNLVANSIEVYGIRAIENDLESIFMNLTNN